MAKKPEKSFATQIGNLIPQVTRASFERYGFAYADLVNKWEMIMGDPICTQCRPAKIVWPRGIKHESERVGGTLHLTCLSAFALDLQHQQTYIIQRINRFYGYEAVRELSFSQKATLTSKETKAAEVPPLSEQDKKLLNESLQDIADPELSKALDALGQNVLRARQKKTLRKPLAKK